MSDQTADEKPQQALDAEADTAQEGLFSRHYAVATLSFAATMFLTGFTALAVVPTLPTAADALDGVSLFPLVTGCFVAASLLGGVLGGNWADRSGARRPLATGMALTVVTLLVAATSTSIWQLALGRFLDGLAAGMVAVSVNTAIGETYPDRLRPRALALMSTSWIIPSLTGPPLAGVVTEAWSWRAVFYGLAVLTLLPAIALGIVLRGRAWAVAHEHVETLPKRPAVLVAATVSVGAALGQYGVSGWDVRHAVFTVAGMTVLVLLAPRLLPAGTWRAVQGLPATVLLRGLGSGVFFTLEAFVPLMLVSHRHVSAVLIGFIFTSASVVWAGASWVQGRVLENWPRHRLVGAGALVQATAVAVAVAGTLPGVPALTAAAAMPLAAVGMGLLEPSLIVLSLVHSSAGDRGYASGAMQSNQNLGQILILGLAAAALNITLAFGTTGLAGYTTAFGLLLLPSLLLIVLSGRTRQH
ncbi:MULTISPECIES: MFS transporter [Streptomyces]|uniref:MFS transporter n=1 Tax=Streptomyces evansiae TaxID=3075535 RepID=A0ABD5EAU6_9ACTN|nr:MULTISPECIES: MFS transporter [unclassified Streptomyces]ASY33110.1 MFS transporter [Streptomyces sp. CLI2509]MDT0418488.1 MFS transporter [Streptomyces sp. DSM 41982]MYX23242.1 MFS transporter [Streptomyces sp. SID8380]SCE03208.1 Predicted arabinose efflux permease, MFS family [Streptomyces sp. SolWspMP-sol7th]